MNHLTAVGFDISNVFTLLWNSDIVCTISIGSIIITTNPISFSVIKFYCSPFNTNIDKARCNNTADFFNRLQLTIVFNFKDDFIGISGLIAKIGPPKAVSVTLLISHERDMQLPVWRENHAFFSGLQWPIVISISIDFK